MKLEELSDQALENFGAKALTAKNLNVALNVYNLLAKRKPGRDVYFNLAQIYRELKRTNLEAAYLDAGIRTGTGEHPEEQKRLKECLNAFLEANPKVKELQTRIAQKPYSNRIIKQRNQFRDALKQGKTAKVFEIGLEQHTKGEIDPEIQNIWCSIAFRHGQHQLALVSAFLAFQYHPSDWICLTNIADILIQLKKQNQALDYAMAAVNMNPKSATSWLNLGAAWEIKGRPWESIRATQKALELNPKNAAAWTNLGNAHKNSGRLVEALPAYREAIKYEPSNMALWSNLLFGINYSNEMTAEEIAQEHFKFGEYIEKKYPIIKLKRNQFTQRPGRLRVGFVSADIRSHPVAYFLEPLWAHMDRRRFEIYCYDNFPTEDDVTRRFKLFSDHWVNVSQKTDDEFIEIILNDQIDVLIDMSGHTAKNRLEVFARKPAPVQVTWLGHPNTTGLTRMDWRITDPYGDPPGNDHLYSEKLWRLPAAAAYAPLIKNPKLRASAEYAVKPTPALQNGYVTFGTCNNLAKLSPAVMQVWSKVLHAVERSKLLIEAPGLNNQEYKNDLIARFATYGIDSDRLVLHERVSTMQYKRYHEMDIALDPFPYAGGTTTFDLLWMGLPMVTLEGDRPMARAGVGVLNWIGHPEWIAQNFEHYVEIAQKLASNLGELNHLRLSIRGKTELSIMMDGAAYSRSFEHALDSMLSEKYGYPYFPPEHDPKYLQALKQGNELLAQSQWREAFSLFDKLRDEFGAEANALFGAGLSCARLGDHQRACRYMADALLRRLEPQWVPWLAASYDAMGYSLPFYVLTFWLKEKHPEQQAHLRLHERATRRLVAEFERRKLEYPAGTASADPKAEAQINAHIVNLLKAEKNEEALAAAEQAVLHFPDAQPILLNSSLAAKRLKQYEKSAIWCLRSFAINPLGYGAITNFGNLLVAADSPYDSMLMLEAGAILMRDDPMLWGNLAVAYNSVKVAPWEAEFAARRALALDVTVATNWNALGKALSRQAKMSEALAAFKKARQLDPKRVVEDLFTLQYAEELSPKEIAEAHFRAGQIMMAEVKRPPAPFMNTLDPHKPLRIGIVSGDLVAHPVAYFMEKVFDCLDQQKYPLYVYFTKLPNQEDHVSQYFKARSKDWRNVSELNDDQLEVVIRNDIIDILIDLSGHTAHNRLGVFARRGAPVQVTYQGHPNTTGLKAIDWKLGDQYATPPELASLFAEKLWNLPDTASVYSPLIRTPDKRLSVEYSVNTTPALENGFITFGSSCNFSKLSAGTIKVWCDILKKVDASRLLIEAPGLHQREFRRDIISRFERQGVGPEQLKLLDRDTSLQYKIYHQVDIALDPFPYNGGTSTCDLLWMGVPLVTLIGNSQVSRLGYSWVSILGYPEWAAKTPQEYVQVAQKLSYDIRALNTIRLGLRATMEKSPLMDGPRFARNLEKAFRGMWQHHIDAAKLSELRPRSGWTPCQGR